MPNKKHDPWTEVRTLHGLAADEVISALQKEIRRGKAENAVLLAYEMLLTSPDLEDYLWQRLMVISVEDVGLGEPDAPALLNALHQMAERFDRGAGDRKLFAVHAVRFLCACRKDRSNDEMLNWVRHAVESGEALAQIPDYALDMHTRRGRDMGRGSRHFWEEGAKLEPELPGRDLTYRQRIMEMLDRGEIE
jgi:replication-associated recombination protein RarA